MQSISRFFISVLVLAALIAPNFSLAATAEELQAQINSLLSTIASLQAQLSQLGGGTTSGGGTPPTVSITAPQESCRYLNINLRVGDTGDDVRYLQQILIRAGYDTEATGYFGERTAAAVSAFQERFSSEILSPIGLTNGTGFLGSSTRGKLNSLYGCGGVGITAPPRTATPPQVFDPSVAVCAMPPNPCANLTGACPAIGVLPTTYPDEQTAENAGATVLYKGVCTASTSLIPPSQNPIYAVKQCDGTILYTHDPNAVAPVCQPTSVPVIYSVSPQAARAGDTVYVDGSAFASQGSYISFVNASVSAITNYVSSSKLSFVVPSLVPNTYKINVREKASDVESNSINFTIQAISATTNPTPAPTTITLSSIYPESGPVGTKVTLSGCGPSSIDGYNLVYSGPTSGEVKIPVVSLGSSCGYMEVSIPTNIPDGTYTVSVRNNSTGQMSSNSKTFTVTPKADTAVTLTDISPTSGPPGTVVTLYGCGSISSSGYSVIYTGPLYGVLELAVTQTGNGCGSMKYTIPNGAPVGTYAIYVRNNQTGQLSKNNMEFVVTEGKSAFPTTSSLSGSQIAGALIAIQQILESMLGSISQ